MSDDERQRLIDDRLLRNSHSQFVCIAIGLGPGVPDTKVESHLENASPCLVLFDSAALADVSYATSVSFNSDDSAMLGTEVISREAFRATPARWYILFAFCYMGMIQGFIGNAWGPVASVMKSQFDWSDNKTSLLALWVPVAFVPGALLFPWVIAWTNMRFVVVGNGALMAFAGALKILSVTVIPMDKLIYTAHISHIINGICGAVPFSGVMFITVNWFPTRERIVATGLVMATLNTGVAIPNLLGPTIIPEPPKNVTPHIPFSRNYHILSNAGEEQHHHKFFEDRLVYYVVIQGISMILCLVFVAIYFPSRPTLAPTASAVTARLDIVQGTKALLHRGNFWLICAVYALTSGVFNGYALTFDVIMQHCKISQTEAGNLAFVGLLASVPTNILIGTLASLFSRYQKTINVSLLIMGSVFFAIFVAEIQDWIEPRTQGVYWLSYVLATMCITGVVPILFDMSAESSHPVSEELSSTVMVLGNQLMCLVFTAILQIPTLMTDSDKDKLNYVMLGSSVIAIFLAVLYRSSNVRLLIDANSITVEQLDTRSIQQIRNAGAM